MRHSLSQKDPVNRTAHCSVDGFVAIVVAGPDKWQCAVAKRTAQQRWRSENPEKSAADRRRRSEHRVTGFDRETMTAQCVKCDGLVGVVYVGLGPACENRQTELGRTHHPDRPQRRCETCREMERHRTPPILLADGSCARCIDQMNATRPRNEEQIPPGMVVETPMELARVETAVRGWKTLGSGNAHEWWAANGHLVESDN